MIKILILLLIIILTTNSQGAFRYEIETPYYPNVPYLAVWYANSQVGTKESTGHNDGPVDKYLYSVFGRRNTGYPYCAAGVFWCFKKSGDSLGIPEKYLPVPKSGLAQHFYTYGVNNGYRTQFFAQKSDILVWRKGNSYSGHVEIIDSVCQAGWVITIGFNTSNGKTGSQREGNGVFRRRRNLYSPIGNLNVRGILGFKRNPLNRDVNFPCAFR